MERPFHIYGSADSTDTDVVIFLDELPVLIEERKILTNQIKKEMGVDWNIIIAKLKDGIIIDCTYPKSSPESLNNAVYTTYKLHSQKHSLLIDKTVKRNTILAVYKTIRTILTYLTRTEYRSLIRPTMNWRFDFNVKLQKLLEVDFTKIESFNQPNVSDKDIWKIYAFYLFQNIALFLDHGMELYTKKDIVSAYAKTFDFLYRTDNLDIEWFQSYLRGYVKLLLSKPIRTDGKIISLFDQSADMETELTIIT